MKMESPMLEIVNIIHFHLSTAASLPLLLVPAPHKAPHKDVHLSSAYTLSGVLAMSTRNGEAK